MSDMKDREAEFANEKINQILNGETPDINITNKFDVDPLVNNNNLSLVLSHLKENEEEKLKD